MHGKHPARRFSMSEHNAIARAILDQIEYITLATVDADGIPWNTPVYAGFDEAYRCYWVSAAHVRHSQNIAATHRAAIVVYDSTAAAGTGKGVYIQARAQEVTDEQGMIHALAVLERRGWKKPLDEVRGSSVQRVYQAIPEQMWINSAKSLNGQQFDSRAPLDLLGTQP
jgi:nitroimidazol reductase NimA-like FMN-containing flavoprotein (pyridoxamine 5'-phosphate oxidase superfamily)